MTPDPVRPPTAVAPRTTRVGVRAVLVCFVTAGLAGVAYLVAATPPTRDSYYPKCTLHQLTGLHCPGCGTGRAAHFALNGHLLTAFRYNPFAVVALPIIAFFVGRNAVRWASGRPRPSRKLARGGWILLLAITLTVYGILRNLPWPPFTALAPVEL